MTSKDIVEISKEWNNISMDDQIILTARLENEINIMNGKEPIETPLMSHEYIDIANNNQIKELPLTRLNDNVESTSTIKEINGRWRILEGDLLAENDSPKIQASHQFIDGKMYENTSYKNLKDIPKLEISELITRAEEINIRSFLDSETVHSGAPIVDKTGSVLTGNRDVLASIMNYKNGDRAQLKQSLMEMGFKDIEKYNNPILSFELTSELTDKDINHLIDTANKPVNKVKDKTDTLLQDETKNQNTKEIDETFDKLDEIFTKEVKEDSIKQNVQSIEDLENLDNYLKSTKKQKFELTDLEQKREGVELNNINNIIESNKIETLRLKSIDKAIKDYLECIA